MKKWSSYLKEILRAGSIKIDLLNEVLTSIVNEKSIMKIQEIIFCGLILFSWCLMGFNWGDILARNTKKGNELFNEGQYDKALQAFTAADVNSKANDPRLPKLYMNMGNTLAKQGKYDQAVAMYQQAFEASDDANFRADAQYNAGNAWLKQGQYQQALKAYQQALELNPKHLQAQQNKELVEKLIVQPPPQQQQQSQNDKNDKEQQEQNKPEEQQSPQENQQQNKRQNQEQNKQQNQEKQAAETQETKEQQLSKEEALRILDALKEKEKLQQQRLQIPSRPVEKDW